MYTPANNHNRSLAMSTQPTPAAARHCKVAIIGTGFSGLGMA
ncbi:hypothetical protein LDZ95_34950, partial [Pseudomonas aeruginosa]|nr:hypothetical protein [Pseudomonas aeruginosa]